MTPAQALAAMQAADDNYYAACRAADARPDDPAVYPARDAARAALDAAREAYQAARQASKPAHVPGTRPDDAPAVRDAARAYRATLDDQRDLTRQARRRTVGAGDLHDAQVACDSARAAYQAARQAAGDLARNWDDDGQFCPPTDWAGDGRGWV